MTGAIERGDVIHSVNKDGSHLFSSNKEDYSVTLSVQEYFLLQEKDFDLLYEMIPIYELEFIITGDTPGFYNNIFTDYLNEE